MLGRDYLLRQTMTLLRMAQTVKDPHVSGRLAVKAADLKDRLDDIPPHTGTPPIAPDSEPQK
jgi:hypothetical protein